MERLKELVRRWPALLGVFGLLTVWSGCALGAQTASKPAVATATPAATPAAKAPTGSPAPVTTATAPPQVSTAPIPAAGPPSSAPPPLFEPLATKSFEVKYIDPEQISDVFAGRPFVIEANRDLKSLTVQGTPAFLKEVEDAIKRFDLPPDAPANIQLTVYLLTVAAQAPAGIALPAELASIGKEAGGTGAQTLRLADSQMMRLRESQSGDVSGGAMAPDAASLSRIHLRSASAIPGDKGNLISLNGLQVWLNIPAPAGSTSTGAKADSDVSADVDVPVNQPVIISETGVDKPVVVVVKVSAVK